MLPFGVTNPATVPQRSEIPEGLMSYPVVWTQAATTSFVVGTRSLLNTQLSKDTPVHKELGQYYIYM